MFAHLRVWGSLSWVERGVDGFSLRRRPAQGTASSSTLVAQSRNGLPCARNAHTTPRTIRQHAATAPDQEIEPSPASEWPHTRERLPSSRLPSLRLFILRRLPGNSVWRWCDARPSLPAEGRTLLTQTSRSAASWRSCRCSWKGGRPVRHRSRSPDRVLVRQGPR